MEDNIEKETLDNPQKTQSEITSDEVLTANITGTIIENQETKKMEVHHHPKVEKKNFKEYLLEGLMIFIAVTLGFFAESIREHFTEVKVTHEYLETYKQELERNKNTIHRYDSIYSAALLADDSMAMLFYNKNENKDLHTTAQLFIKARRVPSTNFDDGAYQQLVNSGGLKYIHRLELKDSMANYAAQLEGFEDFNRIKYADRTAYLPELNSLDDLHDYVGLEKIPEMMPYPTLTEKERRFIVSFYRQFYLQFYSNKKLLASLKNSNNHLLKMVQQEMEK
jgi:hypothetical protein